MAPTRGCNKHWECKNITFLFLLFYCLVQCRDNGDSCIYTELYIVLENSPKKARALIG